MTLTKRFFGANRAETYGRLLEWLEQGPPVCVLEGFAGTGKTALSNDLMRHVTAQTTWRGAVPTTITEEGSLADPLLTIAARLSEDGESAVEDALFSTPEPNFAHALTPALRQYVLLVVDEGQLLLDPEGRATGDLTGVVESLATRSDLPGRLLILSNRVVDRTTWPDVPILTLRDLADDEAEALLDDRLAQAGVAGAVPQERKADVVAALARNPRAIEMLATALRSEPLAGIMSERPDLWDVHDREVSRDFLDELERMLLRRIIGRLPEVAARNLRRLAAYRKDFQHVAIDRLYSTPAEARELRRLLVDRFLLTHRLSVYSLNPLVREMALAQLRETPVLLRNAHEHAAKYYLRDFGVRQIVKPFDGLKGSFAELRYHLLQAGDVATLEEVSRRYSAHIEGELGRRKPLPEGDALDERIRLLSAVLEYPGPESLEYHLAACLDKRRADGDMEKAALHAERATSPGASPSCWVLRARIEAAADPETALATLRGAIERRPAVPLYDHAIDLLLTCGRGEEAVAMLAEALQKIPPAELSIERHTQCARWLWEAGKREEALQVLERASNIVPRGAAAMLFSLYARYLTALDRDETAVEVVQRGLMRVPRENGAEMLYVLAADLLERLARVNEAEALLRKGIAASPESTYSSLYHRLGEILRDAGRPDDAIAALREGIAAAPADFPLYVLAADVLESTGELGPAIDLLREGVTAVPASAGGLPPIYVRLAFKVARHTSASDGVEVLREGVRRATGGEVDYLAGWALALCAASEDWSTFADIIANEGVSDDLKIFAEVVRLNRSAQYAAAVAVTPPQRPSHVLVEQAFALLCLGSLDEAWERIKAAAAFRIGITDAPVPPLPYRTRRLALRRGEPMSWLVTFIHLRRAEFDAATQSMSALLGRPAAPREVNEATLLRVWDGELLGEHNLIAIAFPALPPSLTGRPAVVRRPPFGRPQLAEAPAVAAAYAQALEHLRARAGEQGTRTVVSCFVSYAWGNPSHGAWVRRLGTDLEEAGIDVIGDWKENSFIGGSVARFVDSIAKADFVLMVCTPAYAHKYENRDRDGHVVAAEYEVIAERLLGTDAQKASVLPIILEGTRKTAIPPGLASTRTAGDFTVPANYRVNLLHLMRTLWRVPPDSTFLDIEARVRRPRAIAV